MLQLSGTQARKQIVRLEEAIAEGMPPKAAKRIAKEAGWPADLIRIVGPPTSAVTARAGAKSEALTASELALLPKYAVREVGRIGADAGPKDVAQLIDLLIGKEFDSSRCEGIRSFPLAIDAYQRIPKSSPLYEEARNSAGLAYHHWARDLRALAGRKGSDRQAMLEEAAEKELLAIAEYQIARKADRTDDSPLYNIAVSKLALGDKTQALDYLEQSLVLALEIAKGDWSPKRTENLKASMDLLKGRWRDDDLKGLWDDPKFRELTRWWESVMKNPLKARPTP